MKTKIVIFTDLDGTLLDHDTYQFEEAKPLIVELTQLGIPIIPITSKTFAEMQLLMPQLGLTGPFAVENGAAMYLPAKYLSKKPAGCVWQNGYWVRQFCSRRQHWIPILRKLSSRFADAFTLMTDMTPEALQSATGLSKQQALLAAKREFGEAILWYGTEDEKRAFLEAVTQHGARPTMGGRFLHVKGTCNKGDALTWMLKELVRQSPEVRFKSIALGDGKNDIPMLEAADVAVRIASPVNNLPELSRKTNVFTSKRTGPMGWHDMLSQLLSDHI